MNRIKIDVGSKNVGDIINGKKITGFGKSWSECAEFGKHGIRWDEDCDICGKNGQVDNRYGTCIKHTSGEKKSVCYAYLGD
jgi:hypothetical protein